MGECSVCCEKINLTTHKDIECLYCGYHACHKCVEKFLVENTIRPACMSCKTEWNTEFLREKLSKAFMEKSYREHQKDILFSAMESRTEEFQEIIRFRTELFRLREKARIAMEEAKRLEAEYNAFARRGVKTSVVRERTGGAPCLSEGCRGRMSSNYKCGLCEKAFCPRCHLFLETEDHECKEEDVQTVALLKDNTKPCPECHMGIYKVSGCDQMWCTSCHTCFSWKTGKVVNGPVHNPHFFEFARANGVLRRQPGDIPCGGFPTPRELENRIRVMARKDAGRMRTMMRIGVHLQESTMPSLQRRFDRRGIQTQEAGIGYLTKKIDHKAVRALLYKDARKEEKHRRYYQVVEMLATNLAELMRQFVGGDDTTDACLLLFEYAGNEIRKINRQYNCKLPVITPHTDTGRIESIIR